MLTKLFNLCLNSPLFFSNLKSKLSDPDFQQRHIKSDKDFVRQRKLGFTHLTTMLIHRIVKGISIEIAHFFDRISIKKNCSKQAFSKARKKLKHTAFIELNDLFIKDFYEKGKPELYNEKYRLIAVDGSLIQLPHSTSIIETFGQWKNQTIQGMPMGRSSIVYDICNRVVINSKLASIDISETDLFREQYAYISNLNLPSYQSIYIMDRGYPSHDLCKMISEKGDLFVIRCKKDFCNEVSRFVDTNLKMDTITLHPTVWYTKKGEKRGSRYTECIQIQIFRIELENNQEEYLLTNIPDVTDHELKTLYNLRWNVETHYGYLKESMEIENFSSLQSEGVLQDFYACILASNLTNALINEAQEEIDCQQKKKQNKYAYQINKRTATGILRNQVINILFTENDIGIKLQQLKEQIKISRVAIQPNRKFPRNKLKRSRRKFHQVKKRAL